MLFFKFGSIVFGSELTDHCDLVSPFGATQTSLCSCRLPIADGFASWLATTQWTSGNSSSILSHAIFTYRVKDYREDYFINWFQHIFHTGAKVVLVVNKKPAGISVRMRPRR